MFSLIALKCVNISEFVLMMHLFLKWIYFWICILIDNDIKEFAFYNPFAARCSDYALVINSEINICPGFKEF